MILHRQLLIVLLLGLTFSLFFSGCGSKKTEDVATPVDTTPAVAPEYPGGVYEPGDHLYPNGYYVHTVQFTDESISIISKWFTGELENWELLAKCNPELNPNRIFLGDTLKIPRILMIRQDPMTASFVQESQPRIRRKKPKKQSTPPVKVAQPAPEEVPPAEEEPSLIGPKGYDKGQ